ncbi:MAG: DNA polymerase III subunit beta [Flammeovirgaceae bacterium]
MKFIVSTSTLLKHLSTISGVIPSNPVVPILENFLFEIEGGKLNVTASDLQTSIITELEVEAEENGNIAVPARMLMDTLKNLPEQPVTFTIDFSTYSIEISSDNGRYKLAGENAADFPKVPELVGADKVDLMTDMLTSAIGYTLFSTSNDEMKPAMNGVYFSINEGEVNFVSSDSHRLTRYTRKDVGSQHEASMIIHKKALSVLKASLPSINLPLTLEYNDSNAIFSFENVKLICRLIDERFPDYNNVIPLNNDNHVVLDRGEMIGCLKRLVIYANKSTNQVRFKITGNELKVSAEDLDFSNEATERVFCEHDGADIEIGFNAKFLIEMLNNLHSEKIILQLSEPGRAGLVIPREVEADEDILMLVMPIMLHNYA